MPRYSAATAPASGRHVAAMLAGMLLAAAVVIAGLWGATHCELPANTGMGGSGVCTSAGHADVAPVPLASDARAGNAQANTHLETTGPGAAAFGPATLIPATLDAACVLGVLCVLAWAMVLLSSLPRFLNRRLRAASLRVPRPIRLPGSFGSRGLHRVSLPALGLLRI